MSRSAIRMEQRNLLHEKQERRRYDLLEAIHELTGSDCSTPIGGLRAGFRIGMSREETFRHVQYLAHHGYLSYIGAGPTICISPAGVEYLEHGARRRRSIRE